MRKILKNERGSEVIEFVILFPILIFLIFGAITFFLATYSKIIIADAAREGARAGALAVSEGDVELKARTRAMEVINGAAVGALKTDNTLVVDVDLKDDSDEQYKLVEVTVTGEHKSLVPAFVGDLHISSSAVFKREKR